MQASAPIGIFDSGIGGLTVAHAVAQLLPQESIIYFGDTAHLPYGDKSTAAIQAYAVKISDVLLQKHCKAILIACNSASAAAYELVKEYVGSKALTFNVIEPIVNYVGQQYPGKHVGLIGTKQTVSSNVYARKVDALNKDIVLQQQATPLLASMIEEGFFNDSVSQQIIESYLQQPTLQNIEALVLACTHYPLIKHQIARYYQEAIPVLDTSGIVASTLKKALTKHNLLNPNTQKGTYQFLVSDYTRAFEASTRLFFGQEVHLEKYPLWE